MLMKTTMRSTIIHITTITLILLTTGLLNHKFPKPIITISKQESAINFNNSFLKIINIGNKRIMTAILWIKTIIESDIDHYKEDKLNNWMYLRFDSIINLDPKFLDAYQFGGVYLSIVKDDLIGASDIYERGLLMFPDDYQLNFNAGFHFFYEVGDEIKALPLFKKIMYNRKAPPFMPSIVSKIQADRGDIQSAYQMMIEAYNRSPEKSFIRTKFHESLYAIRAEIDLKCLNEHHENCSLNDFDQNPYIKKDNGEFVANKKWELFRIRNRKVK